VVNIKLSTLVFKGLSWSFACRIVSNLSQLFIYFILARILQPAEFGVMALLAVFINISNLFATAGLGSANIQSQSPSVERFSTLFYLALALSAVIYLFIYLLAPYLGEFLDVSDEFVSLLRIYGVTILFTVVSTMQISELSKNLEFEKIFYCSTIPSVISGVISVFLAYSDFGIYALIANVGIARLLSILFYSYYYPPFPRLFFSFKIAKKSAFYSGNLFFISLLDEIYRSSIVILIGKFYNSSLLGYYNVGRQIPGFISSTINATAASVFFPVFSKLQKDLIRGKVMLRKSIRTLNVLIFPTVCLTLLLADEIVHILLTDKWLPSVIYLKLFSVILGLHHIYMTSSAYINSLGHSFVTLKYSIFNKSIAFVVLALTLNDGIEAIIYGQLLVVILLIIFNTIPNRKYIKYSFKEQASDIVPILAINIFLYFSFSAINFEMANKFFQIILVTSIFLLVYLLMVFTFRLQVISDWSKIFKSN